MHWLNFIFPLCALAWVVLCCLWFRDLGYKSGERDGYTRGRKDECDWWQGIERDMSHAEFEIWKEEARKAKR